MKKIKLFTLALAALFAGNVMAQTTIFQWGNMNASTMPQATIGTLETDLVYQGIKIGTNKTSVYGIKADGSIKFADKVTKYIKISVTGGFQMGDTLRYSHAYNNSSDKVTTICVANSQGNSVYSGTPSNNTRKVDNPTIDTCVLSEDADFLYLGRQGETSTFVLNIEVIRPAETQDPVLNVNAKDVDLSVSHSKRVDSKQITFSGKNLAAGTYNLVLTEVDGLTINPATVTVGADGVLKETVTIAYTSEVDVEENTANLALTIGKLTSNVTINYRARISQLQQLAVSENTTWDWAKAGVSEIKFDVKDNDTIVLANADGIANDAQFNSQALKGSGEYVVRDGKYYQGAYLSFIVENAGNIKVKFSNTGNRTSEAESRYLYVNGTKTAFGSWKSKDDGIVTTEAIAVPAGKVELTFMQNDETLGNVYARIYSIEYTKSPSTAIDNAVVAEKAQKMIINGQLVIVKDGVRYNAQGVQL